MSQSACCADRDDKGGFGNCYDRKGKEIDMDSSLSAFTAIDNEPEAESGTAPLSNNQKIMIFQSIMDLEKEEEKLQQEAEHIKNVIEYNNYKKRNDAK